MKPNTNSTEGGEGSNRASEAADAPSDRSRIGVAAFILCLLPAIYFLAVTTYALLNADAYASDLPRLLRYVIGPLLIALALLLAARLRDRETSLMIGITSCAVLFGLFAFEAYMTLRLLPKQIGVVGVLDEDESDAPYQNNLPPAYTIKSLNSFSGIEKLDQAVLSAVPDQPVLLCSDEGEPVTYQADRYGFRNPPEAYAAPAEIMVLGDSFAEGLCLRDGDDLASQIRAQRPALINTASRGAGPVFELAVLGRFGPVFQPKVTLLAFFEGNDWDNLEGEPDLTFLQQVFDPDTDFGAPEWSDAQHERTKPVLESWWQGNAATTKEYLTRRSELRNFFALQNTALVLGLHYPKDVDPNPDYPVLLARAREITGQWGGDLVLVYIPSHDRFGGLFPHQFVQEPLRRMVYEAANQQSIEIIDLTDVFNDQPRPKRFYAADSHFNAEGASVAADAIVKQLKSGGFIE